MMVATRPPKAYVLARLCLFTLLLLPQISLAKNCTSRDITLADQGDVNLFQQAFSGGGTCDTITGTLRIEDTGGTDITDLTPLRDLRYINGDLIVYNTYKLESLEGLEGIQRVGGDLNVNDNDELGDCAALYQLLDATPTTQLGVGGEIYIAYNAAGCNSRGEIVDAVKYGLVSCPAFETDPFGLGLPFYKVATQSDVSELRQITGGQCNKLPGMLWIGEVDGTGDWNPVSFEISDISELSWLKSVDLLIVRGNWLITSLYGLHNLVGTFQIVDLVFLPFLSDLEPLSGLTSQENAHPEVSSFLQIVGTNIKTLDPLKSISGVGPDYYWWLVANPLLADCEWRDGAEPYIENVADNAPGCNSYDEIISYWNEPRHDLTLTASPGGSLGYGFLSGSNGGLAGGIFGFPLGPSVPVPKGLSYTFSPSPRSAYNYDSFSSDCSGGPRSSTQEFILSSMEDDCYLHVNYSREPTDPDSVASAKTIAGSSCKVEQPALEPSVEWREQGLLNVSDEPVAVICPLPRTSYLGRDQQYFSDETTVAVTFSVDEVSSAHTECTLIASESVAELVTPARASFRLHGWATDSGEITINPESYPVPSQPDVLSHHAMRCLLQPGVGISGLKIESIN